MLNTQLPMRRSKFFTVSDEEFTKYISNSHSWSMVSRQCYGYKTQPGIVECKKRALALKLDTNHINGLIPYNLLKPGDRPARRSGKVLKQKILKSGVLDICQWCRCENMKLDNGNWLWVEKPLSMQVDHIHGRSKPPCEEDDRLENLRLLCPNCHSQTHNHLHAYKVNPATITNEARAKLLASEQEYYCEMCKCEYMQKGFNGAWEWRDWMIKLECDHIDGDRSNNDISNLRWLCPNCHSTTDTYAGRNVKRKALAKNQTNVKVPRQETET